MSLNPLQDLATQAIIGTVLLGSGLVFGFIGGCEYHKDKTQKLDLAREKANARVEKQDAIAGNNASAAIRKVENQIQQQADDAVKKAAGKPVVIVKTKAANCPTATSSQENLSTPLKAMEPVNETTVAYFSPDFVELYDSTLQAGNSEFRARVDEKTEAVRADEEFKEFIARNNKACASYSKQLDALISRIEEKKRIFKEPE